MRVKPEIGDVVTSTVTTETLAGFVVGVDGIHIWIRFFDTAAQGESWDVYTRRDNVKVVSHGRD